jgi:competence protein ComEA
MKRWLWILYGVLIGLLSAGAILLISQPRQGKPIILSPAPSPTPTSPPGPTATPVSIQAQIGGEVNSPGVYTPAEGHRLNELIEMAGGLTDDADIERINLAMLVRDGDYFYIPAVDEDIPETANNAPGNLNTVQNPEYNYPLDLNEASQEALESIPGIGPAKAEDIIAYKAEIGRFTALEELLNVSGIGETTLESLKDYLYIKP